MDDKPALYMPVAEYLRMSTEPQQYSIDNQEGTIRSYAEQNQMRVVKSYVDAGISGLVLKHRRGLIQLLKDVVDGTQEYKAILVYDVSRWGRFQDIDEAAYYEFLCKRAGIRLHYCAESFHNDESMPNVVMKALKRVMASEYSRELSDRVFKGAKAMIERGFSNGAVPVYGLRRMLCSSSGEPKLLLKDGERKNIKEDRIKLVPGPADEIKWVREIFRLFTERRSTISIAKFLNEAGAIKKGKPWHNQNVVKILRDEKYAGTLIWGRRTMKLHSRNVPVPREHWTIVRNAIEPIIVRELFEKAQRVLRECFPSHFSDAQLLSRLQPLLRRKGRLSAAIINESRTTPSAGYYEKRFGSLQRVYELAGYKNTGAVKRRREAQQQVSRLHARVLQSLRKIFDSRFTVRRRNTKIRARILRFSNGLMLSVVICRYEETIQGSPRWRFQSPSAVRHGYMTLLCRCSAANTGIRHYSLMPSVTHLAMASLLHEDDPRLQAGRKLKGLRELKKLLFPENVASHEGLGTTDNPLGAGHLEDVAKKEKHQNPAQLRGWDEIIKFLMLPFRTAKRWRKLGMPVTRVGQYVYANPEELNDWVAKKSPSRLPAQIARDRGQ
jgi:DNA invertase Pin-like site-specific DNA recombinase